MRGLILGSLLAGLSLASASAQAQDAAPTIVVEDDGATEPTWFLVGIGAGLFFGEYLGELAITAAMGGTAEELERAAIPLAGPWLELSDGSEREWWEVGLTVYEGVMQIAALTLVVVGFAWQRPTSSTTTVALAPTALPGGAGLVAAGSFE